MCATTGEAFWKMSNWTEARRSMGCDATTARIFHSSLDSQRTKTGGATEQDVQRESSIRALAPTLSTSAIDAHQ
jgi:hypothetical protein